MKIRVSEFSRVIGRIKTKSPAEAELFDSTFQHKVGKHNLLGKEKINA